MIPSEGNHEEEEQEEEEEEEEEGKCSGNIIHAASSGFVRVAGLTSAAGTREFASNRV